MKIDSKHQKSVEVMRCLCVILIIIFSAVSSAVSGGKTPLLEQCKGYWAVKGELPYENPDSAPKSIPSPNGKLSINGSDDGLYLKSENNGISRIDVAAVRPLAEVLWAPDSKHFAINFSDGGLVGTWNIKVFAIDKNIMSVPLNVKRFIVPAANKLLKCEPEEVANLGVASWLNNGKELLVVAAVPNHSTCRNMGDISGFRVSAKSGRIIQQYSGIELRKKWKQVLGCGYFGQR